MLETDERVRALRRSYFLRLPRFTVLATEVPLVEGMPSRRHQPLRQRQSCLLKKSYATFTFRPIRTGAWRFCVTSTRSVLTRAVLSARTPRVFRTTSCLTFRRWLSASLIELHVFGNDYKTPDGTGVRDYIHVVDLALGHVKAVDWALKNTRLRSRLTSAPARAQAFCSCATHLLKATGVDVPVCY